MSPAMNIRKLVPFSFFLLVSLCPHTFSARVFSMPLVDTLTTKHHLQLADPRHYESEQGIWFMTYSPDGKFIINTGHKNLITIRDAETGTIFRTLSEIKKRTRAIVATSDNQLVYLAGDEGIIYKWSPNSQDLSKSKKEHAGPIYAMVLSPDQAFLLTGGKDGLIRLWDATNLSLIRDFRRHEKAITALDFSHDGKTFAAGSADGTISEWSLDSHDLLNRTNPQKGYVRCVAYSPDDYIIASGGDDMLIHLWKGDRLEEAAALIAHTDWVQCLDFHPSGKYLVSGGHDQQIFMWDLTTYGIIGVSVKQEHIVTSTKYSPDGKQLLSSCLLAENYQLRELPPLPDQVPQEKIVQQVTEDSPEETAEQPPVEQTIEKTVSQPVITLFSPEFRMGRAISEQTDITLLGKITDPMGISAVMINKEPLELSQAGIFEYKLSLKKGLNDFSLIAVNKEGTLSKKQFSIECTAETPEEEEVVPEVYSGNYYALIIAINEYDDPNILDLDMPLEDAQSLYSTLIKRYTFEPERINFLKNPSRAEIIMALDELSRIVTEDDNLLIFYAGHGYWDEQGKIGYWLPRDAMKSNTANWVRNSTMRDFIGSIKSKHTILIADACFSGSIFKSRAAFSQPPGGISKLHSLPSRKAMTSGTLELVPDESIFLKFLIKRLEKNDKKFLPSESLYSEMKPAVLNNSPNIPQFGTIQNVGDEGGDFIFILK